jgi:hypothetical protein
MEEGVPELPTLPRRSRRQDLRAGSARARKRAEARS